MTNTVDATVKVADEIRGLMAKHRISQSQIGEWLNMSQAGVSRRLSGLVAFDINELDLIARGMGVPLTELVGGVS